MVDGERWFLQGILWPLGCMHCVTTSQLLEGSSVPMAGPSHQVLTFWRHPGEGAGQLLGRESGAWRTGKALNGSMQTFHSFQTCFCNPTFGRTSCPGVWVSEALRPLDLLSVDLFFSCLWFCFSLAVSSSDVCFSFVSLCRLKAPLLNVSVRIWMFNLLCNLCRGRTFLFHLFSCFQHAAYLRVLGKVFRLI